MTPDYARLLTTNHLEAHFHAVRAVEPLCLCKYLHNLQSFVPASALCTCVEAWVQRMKETVTNLPASSCCCGKSGLNHLRSVHSYLNTEALYNSSRTGQKCHRICTLYIVQHTICTTLPFRLPANNSTLKFMTVCVAFDVHRGSGRDSQSN